MEQRTEEWFAARKGRITASAVGAILGNSPWMSPDDVMRMMVRDWRGAEREFTGNIATEYGTAMEPEALKDMQIETGHDIEAVGFIPYCGWAGCSPDGMLRLNGIVAGVEIKCPFGLRKDADPAFKTLKEQPHYYDQVQFSIFVTGASFWEFFQWTPHSFHSETVYPDYEWQAENVPKLLAFHDRYLSIRDDENSPYLEPKRAVIDTPDAHSIVAEYDQLAEAIDNATARKKELLAAMVEMAKGKNATFAGRKLSMVERAGSVSYSKALKAIAPDADLEPYRGKPSTSWRLT